MIPRVLIIAGSDSSGGAGIQADIKTVSALGGYAMTAITALTAQNTVGVFGIHEVPPEFIRQQMELALSDIGADAIKTGMLHSAEVIRTVAAVIREKAPGIPLVVDPVMIAKGGAKLLQEDAMDALKYDLIPLATLVTPNTPEASELTSKEPIETESNMNDAARLIHAYGTKAVLIKGGHLPGDEILDLLSVEHEIKTFTSPRLATRHTHGTGCTLASAIATYLGRGLPLEEAVEKARNYVWQAIWQAPGFGEGHGPLWHGHMLQPMEK